MLLQVRLQNYTSFGDLQEAPLEPITVIVGPNNSGKTNFLRFVDFVRAPQPDFQGHWHRPSVKADPFRMEWDYDFPSEAGSDSPKRGTYAIHTTRHDSRMSPTVSETVTIDDRKVFSNNGILGQQSQAMFQSSSFRWHGGIMAQSLREKFPNQVMVNNIEDILASVTRARHVHLRLEALRADNSVEPTPSVGNGSQLAAVVTRWLLEFPETYAKYNEFIARCLPEMKRVLIRSNQSGQVRLFFEQKDGERFDATQVSDGVMFFAGLIAHALESPPRSLVLLEEPERGIHPRRLIELIDLLRTLVHEQQNQFVLATHSPVLLNSFRDEREAVLVFRRGPRGTVVRRLADMPELADTLDRADPGELLANGVFNEATTIE